MKARLLIAAAAVLIIGSISVKPAIAFFTGTCLAEGKIELTLGDGRLDPMDDTVENMVKKISIKNTGEYDILVRAKAFAPDNVTVTMEDSTGWSESDGYYYYSEIVGPNESSDKLNLKIKASGEENFNVIIIQEATKVLYDEAGKPYGDWNAAISTQLSTDGR